MSGVGTVTRNAAWLMGQRLLMGVFSVLVVAVVARYLGTERYGELVLLLSYNALLAQFASLGLRPYSVREMAADRPALPRILADMMTLRSALAIAVALVAALWLDWVDPLLPDSLIAVLAMQIVANAVAMSFVDGLYGVEAIKDVAKVLGLSGMAVQLASLLAVAADAGLFGVACAYVFGSVVTIAAGWWLLRAHVVLRAPSKPSRGLLAHVRESRVFFLQSFVHTIRQRLDVVIITGIAGAHVAGVYGASLTLVQRLDTIQDAIATAIFPRVASLAEKGAEELRELVRQSYKLVLVVALPLAVGIFGIADDIVRLVFGAKFMEAVPVLAAIALAIPFSFLYGLLYNVFSAMGRQDTVFRAAAVVLLPGLAAMAAAVWLAGPVGAGIAFTVVVAVLALTLVVIYSREYGALATFPVYARLFAANAVMGALLAVEGGLPLAVRIAACIAAYAVAVLGFRVVTPRTLKALFRRGSPSERNDP